MSRLPALAIETSGRVGSVALVEDGVVTAEEEFPHGLQHAARIIPVCDSLCASRGLKPSDLRELYISIGPGSFTGLRVGITMAKTLAFASQSALNTKNPPIPKSPGIAIPGLFSDKSPKSPASVKLVAVPSVRVLVQNAPLEATHVAIVLDAKRGQIFTARFERVDGKWIDRAPAHLDTLREVVARAPRPLYLLGEGLPYHTQFLDAADSSVIQTPAECWRARASVVASIGYRMAREGRFTQPNDLLPLYVRVPEAEEKYGKPGGVQERKTKFMKRHIDSRSVSHEERVLERLREDPEFATEYLKAAMEDDDEPRVLLIALRRIAEARGGIASVARKAGIERESLHRALSGRGNPRFSTLAAVAKAVGLRLTVESA